jgi:hypothetical protein
VKLLAAPDGVIHEATRPSSPEICSTPRGTSLFHHIRNTRTGSPPPSIPQTFGSETPFMSLGALCPIPKTERPQVALTGRRVLWMSRPMEEYAKVSYPARYALSLDNFVYDFDKEQGIKLAMRAPAKRLGVYNVQFLIHRSLSHFSVVLIATSIPCSLSHLCR